MNYSFCQNSHFDDKFNNSEELYYLNIRYWFTINIIHIQGLYKYEIYKYVEFTFSMKKNKNSETNFEEWYILLTQNDSSFKIYFTNFAFDLNNYKNPIRRFYRNKFEKLEIN